MSGWPPACESVGPAEYSMMRAPPRGMSPARAFATASPRSAKSARASARAGRRWISRTSTTTTSPVDAFSLLVLLLSVLLVLLLLVLDGVLWVAFQRHAGAIRGQ